MNSVLKDQNGHIANPIIPRYEKRLQYPMIEELESSDGHVKKTSIKYENGLLINTVSHYHKDNVSAWNNLFISSDHSGEWLTPFKEVFSVTSGIEENNIACWPLTDATEQKNKLTQTPRYWACSAANLAIIYRMTFIALGRWK